MLVHWRRRSVAVGLACGGLAVAAACASAAAPGPSVITGTPTATSTVTGRAAPSSSPPTTTTPTTPTTPTASIPVPAGSASASASPLLSVSVSLSVSPAPPPLPSGPAAGTDPFAGRRIVAFYGAPGSSGLGVLGQGTPAQAWQHLDQQAAAYGASRQPALRCFELIATVASDAPGSSGLYRNHVSAAAIAPYLAEIRAHRGTLLLDIQPGRADFLSEAEYLEPLLSQPDVGLALDPEWRMGPGQVPGQVIGSVTAAEIDTVSDWLENLTVTHHLPDKLLVVHQFTSREITGEDDLVDAPHLHEILNVDGFGRAAAKIAIYRRLAARSPYPTGLKLFYRQDIGLLAPATVLALRPAPTLINYQ